MRSGERERERKRERERDGVGKTSQWKFSPGLRALEL
jgi:hypothetical protein